MLVTAITIASQEVTQAAHEAAFVPHSQFQGFGGAVIVSLIAFTIVFSVLAALSAMIFVNRYIAAIAEKKDKGAKTAPSASAPAAAAAPVIQASPDANDMKKVVAVISAAINASVGKSVNIISIRPAQGNCSNTNVMWRAAGIAECMASRLGTDSRSW
ncbi:MAG: OadG family protein [Synergistaceae bacterium]|nr:OadG family protein [Synergistaceae bacterium]